MAESGQPKAVRVLLVEDSTEDTELVVLELRRAGFAPAFKRVDSPSAMIAALGEQAWDVVLCDYTMPHFSAADALAQAAMPRTFGFSRRASKSTDTVIGDPSPGQDFAVDPANRPAT